MIPFKLRRALAAVALLAALGCSKAEEKAATSASPAPTTSPATTETPATADTAAAKPEAPIDLASLPEVVCRVNGYEVPRADLVQATAEARAQLAQRGQAQATTPTLVRGVLDYLVSQILLEQEGRKAGIQVSDQEVDQQIGAMKAQAQGPERFAQALAQRGVTEDQLKEQIRRQLAVERYLRSKVVVRTPPEEAAVQSFYEQNAESMMAPERRHLRHILILAKADAPQPVKLEARTRADALLARLKKGEDFAKLAAEFSDDPGSKTRGGDLSWVTRGQTVPPFEEAAFALQKTNELSAVVESPYGYHIIQLLEIQAPAVRPYAEVRGRIAQYLEDQKAREQVDAKLKELRAKATVQIFL